MRVKELWSLVPVPQTLVKHLYSSLTLSRYTIIFTLSLLIYTLTLSSLHISAYVTTHTADLTLSDLMSLASIRTNLIPVITTNQDGQDVLQLCDGIQQEIQSRCSTVFVPSPTSTQTKLPNNVQSSLSITHSGSSQATLTPTTLEAVNAPPTTATTATSTSTPGDNLLAATPTTISSTSTSTANASTSLALGIAEFEPTTSRNSTTATARLKDEASAAVTSSTAIGSSSTVTSTHVPATKNPNPTANSRETSPVEKTTTTSVDTVTGVPPLIKSVSSLTSSSDTSTNKLSTTDVVSTASSDAHATTTSSDARATTTSSKDRVGTTSTSSTDKNSATSTSKDFVSSTQTSASTEVKSTSTIASSAASKSSADVSIASQDPSTTSSSSVGPTSDATLSIESVPLSTSPTPSSTLDSSFTSTSSSLASTTTGSTVPATPDVRTGPEVPQVDSPSSQPLPDVPKRRAVLRRSLSATPVTNSTGQITGLNITGLQSDGSSTLLDLGCASALTLVEEQLHESWTEDLVMVGYHIWLLLLGLVAIASESIPHTLASLFSTTLALVWSASQLSESRTFYSQFTQFITDGACDGVDLLPAYWSSRMKVDVAIFVLDALAVVTFAFMGSRLVKDYRKRMSVVVGQGEERRVYKTVLLLSVVIQLGAFLQLASLSLWVQQLFTSPIALASSSTSIFKPLSLISILVTIPWLVLGLFAIRRESKPLILVFILIDVAFLGEWLVFFSSDVYRLMFTKWTFFAAGTVGSFAVLVGCLMSGVLAWMQFGRGLSEKLAQSILDPVDTTSWDFSSTTEKAWEPFGTEKTIARSHTLGGSIGGGGSSAHKPSSSFERNLDPFSSNPGFGTGGLGIGNVGLGYDARNYGSLGFGKQQIGGDGRHGSNLTSLTGSSGRESQAFSYGLRSPAPPVPSKREEYLSAFSN